MGATWVEVTVTNPAEPRRAWAGAFLVDTGASDGIVPRKCLEAIGLSPERSRQYELADGSLARFDVAGAQLEFMGETAQANVVFGSNDTEPLLGFLALEATGMEVDPLGGRLKKRRTAGYLVGLRPVEE